MTVAYANALKDVSTKASREVITNQGGVAHKIDDDLKQLKRFLILGTEGGTFYVSEQKLTKDNTLAVIRALDEHGIRAVEAIIDVSACGLALKQEPTMMALALAASHKNLSVRRYALEAIPSVCRTPTMLFTFINYVQELRGWGRSLRNAIAKWYTTKELDDLVYQVIKYRQREGWTHADVLRKAHPKTNNNVRNALFKWIVDGEITSEAAELDRIRAFESLQKTDDKESALRLIRNFNLPREAVPTQMLNDRDVWSTLLEDMPMLAMIRNLGNMSSAGLFDSYNDNTKHVVEQLNSDRVKKSRVHPMQILFALKTYMQGQGFRGNNTWKPSRHIVDALDAAFYQSFGNVKATNKDILVAVDTSGSMRYANVANGLFTANEIAAAMALITLAAEPNAEIVAFDTMLYHPRVSARQRLDDVTRSFNFGGGGTCIHLPINNAKNYSQRYDAFVVYTDAENGGSSVTRALSNYRRAVNPQAKFVNAATAANYYTAANPNDPLSFDVVGFSADVPNVISGFISNEY